MSLIWANRVKETTTTTGTGALILLGAVTGGYFPFSTIGDSNTCKYTIDDGAGNVESGQGTYTLSSNSLSRDSVETSTNGNSLVNFGAGIKTVWLDAPASWLSAVPNANLANSSITLNTHVVSLGGSLSVAESDLTFTDITTNNVSTSKHGFAPKAPNDSTKFLDGTGAYSVPAGGTPGGSDLSIQFNSDSAFGGAATVTWDDVANVLSVSTNATASNPPFTLTGTWFSGGSATTTKPQVLIESSAVTLSNTWSTAGTGIGANAAASFTGNLIDLQVNGTSQFSVSAVGNLSANGLRSNKLQLDASTGIFWTNATQILGSTNGVLSLLNNGSSDFTRLALGSTTSSFPALGRSTTFLTQTLADGTAGGGIKMTGLMAQYNNVNTVGAGLPSIYGLDNRTGLTSADGAAITLYAATAANQIYRVSADIFATAAVTGTANYSIVWTENGTTQTSTVSATAINVLGTATNMIRPDNATNITAQLTGTFTGTFSVVGSVERIA